MIPNVMNELRRLAGGEQLGVCRTRAKLSALPNVAARPAGRSRNEAPAAQCEAGQRLSEKVAATAFDAGERLEPDRAVPEPIRQSPLQESQPPHRAVELLLGFFRVGQPIVMPQPRREGSGGDRPQPPSRRSQ